MYRLPVLVVVVRVRVAPQGLLFFGRVKLAFRVLNAIAAVLDRATRPSPAKRFPSASATTAAYQQAFETPRLLR
jgi:hypothetical protein